jgi:hypothetical protein
MRFKNNLAFAAAAMLTAVALAGCNEQQIAETQKTTQTICAFVPTAASVAGILSALYPAASAPVGVATQVASQICSAVTAKGARRGGSHQPTVAGVVVEGHFVH